MERDVSMAMAQPGGNPSSPGALAHPKKLGHCCRLGCPTAELPEMLPCSPRCCVFTHPGWRWGTVLWWAPTAAGAHTLQRGLHVPSPRL